MFSDWLAYFWAQIQNPGVVLPGVFNLPWLFVILQPLRPLGPYPALALIDLASIGVVAALARQMGVAGWRAILVATSAPVVWCAFLGQLDGLLLAAYLAPPPAAAFLALCKPQVGLSAGWGAFRRAPLVVALVSGLALASAWAIWGWPFSASNPVQMYGLRTLVPPLLAGGWNWSLWPWGLLLIPWALRDPQGFGLLASPLIFPYAGLQSWIGPVLYLAARMPGGAFVLAWLALWARWAWMIYGGG